MSVILLLAASLVAAAAVLANLRRPAHPSRPVRVAAGGGSASRGLADERGITLQTLIITAVVVLLAVAVGVVIIAVTGSSSDDLEETAPEVAGHCNEVEIYDPEIASRNEKGKQVAYTNFATPTQSNLNPVAIENFELVEFEGSDIGCVPVCIWTEPILARGDGVIERGKNRELQAGEVLFVRDLSQRPDLVVNVEKPFRTLRERRIYLLASGNSLEEITYFARENKGNGVFGDLLKEPVHDEGFLPDRGSTGPQYEGTGSNARVRDGIVRVAVSPDGKECLTYDEYGNILLNNQPL